jgi:hypothetical protein
MFPLIITRHRKSIVDLDSWFSLAPPKGGRDHWDDGRSAKELARAWCEDGAPAVPFEIQQLLESHSAFRHAVLEHCHPEHRVRIDSFPGEPRNADLNIQGHVGADRIVISVEGKADESFGSTVRATLAAADRRSKRGLTSNGKARVESLLMALFGESISANDVYLELPYQLLTATAGTLAFAKESAADTALLVVHEFVGGRRSNGKQATKSTNLERNAKTLDKFVTQLLRTDTVVVPGRMVGPVAVPGNEFIPANVEFFIGKARRTLYRAGA